MGMHEHVSGFNRARQNPSWKSRLCTTGVTTFAAFETVHFAQEAGASFEATWLQVIYRRPPLDIQELVRSTVLGAFGVQTEQFANIGANLPWGPFFKGVVQSGAFRA